MVRRYLLKILIAVGVHADYALDALAAMPVADVPHDPFRAQRWPRIEAHVALRRASCAKRRKRRDTPNAAR